jgi:hypothetical protein
MTLLFGYTFSYYSGIISGILMLLLFLYPLRKYLKIFRGVGNMKYWFMIHVILGLLTPISVLIHTQLMIGSINGAFAFYSMCVVVMSGIIGRYILRHLGQGRIWTELFSWWHVAHVPILYIMAFAVLLHIVAVHMY